MRYLPAYEVLKRVLYRSIGTRRTRQLRIYSPATLLLSVRMRKRYAEYFDRARRSFSGTRVHDEALSDAGFKVFRRSPRLPEGYLERIEAQFEAGRSLSFTNGLTEPGTNTRANYTYLTGEALRQLEVDAFVASRGALLDALEAHLGSHVRINHISIYKTYPGGFADAYSFLWHRDNQPQNSYKLFVYLTDVSSGAGPLMVGPGTHTEGVAFPRFGESRCTAPPTVQVFEGRAGDAILFNVNIIHCGGRGTSKERIVLVASLTPSLVPWREFLAHNGYGTLPETHLEYHVDPSCVFW